MIADTQISVKNLPPRTFCTSVRYRWNRVRAPPPSAEDVPARTCPSHGGVHGSVPALGEATLCLRPRVNILTYQREISFAWSVEDFCKGF